MEKDLVVLTMTREQAEVAKRALELHARMQIGQFEHVIDIMMLGFDGSVDEYCRRRDDARDALKLAACLVFGRNVWGWPDTKKNDDHNRAWMLYEALRYTMAWHDNPEGGFSVCYDKPMQWIDGERMPECKIVEEKEEQK